MHEERKHQPHGNDIDWKVAALDGLGLLLFFIPGVAAFAVDFYTGAIYLPLEQSYPGYGTAPLPPPTAVPLGGPPQAAREIQRTPSASLTSDRSSATVQNVGLKRVALSREQLHAPALQQIVSAHVGREVQMEDQQARVSELVSIDRFDDQLNRHRSDHHFGQTISRFFS